MKVDDTATPEEWVFAILGGMARPHANFNPAGARTLMLCVLPSDGTLGSEVRCLAAAYEQTAKRGDGARHHMPWLRPVGDLPLTPNSLPRPFLDLPRTIRLRENGAAAYEATNARRIDARAAPLIDDPHVPVEIRAGRDAQPYHLQGQREWSHVALHAALAGRLDKRGEVRPARILSLLAEYSAIRICALRGEQGKTMGYRERLIAAPPRAVDFFGLAAGGGEDRPGELSRRILEALANGRGVVLVPALYTLGLDQVEVYARAREFDDDAGMASVPLILELLGGEPAAAIEQRVIHQLARHSAERVFLRGAEVCLDPLRRAKAELELRDRIRSVLPLEETMDRREIPALARRVHAALGEIAEHLTPDERAALRSMRREAPPMCVWAMLARAPADLTGLGPRDDAWLQIFQIMGRVAPAGGSIGHTLAEENYPEPRMRQLLVARGPALRGLCDEALRWLVARDVTHAPLSDLLALALTDATGDATTLAWLRRAIAMGYVRASSKVDKAA